MSSKERHFEIVLKVEKETVFYDDTPMEDVEWSIKNEIMREHNIDCDEPDVELTIEEVKYE